MLAAYIRSLLMNVKRENSTAIITAFELILNGENTYYRHRLSDPEFVSVVAQALEAEKQKYEKIAEVC